MSSVITLPAIFSHGYGVFPPNAILNHVVCRRVAGFLEDDAATQQNKQRGGIRAHLLAGNVRLSADAERAGFLDHLFKLLTGYAGALPSYS